MALFGNPSLGGQSFSDQLALLGASLRDDPNALVNMRSLIANRQMQQGRLALASNVLGYGAQAPDGSDGTQAQAPAAQPQAQDATSAPSAPGGDATAPAPAPISPDALAAAPRTVPVAGSQSPLARAVASGDPAQIARLQVGLKLAGVDADLAPYLPDYKEANGVLYDSKTGRQLSGEVGTQLAVAPSGMAYDVHDASMRGRQGLGAPPVAGYVPQYDPNTGNFAGWADPKSTVKAALQSKSSAEAAGAATIGTPPAPGYVLRYDPITGAPRWVDPDESVKNAISSTEGARADVAASHDMVKVDVPGQPGVYTFVSRSSLGAGGGSSPVPTAAGSKAAGRPTFNIPGQGSASGPQTFGTQDDPAHNHYKLVTADQAAVQMKAYSDSLPQLAAKERAVDGLIAATKAGAGQGGANAAVMAGRGLLATLGVNSEQLKNYQDAKGFRSMLLSGVTSGTIPVRSIPEFLAVIAKLGDGNNTQATNLTLANYMKNDLIAQRVEANAALKFSREAGGLDGTIMRNGRPYHWDDVRSQINNRYAFHL